MDRSTLQSRLVKFAVTAAKLLDAIEPNTAGRSIAWQLLRSSNSPALNYAESQSAESTKDFVHKLGIALKELRETEAALRIIEEAGLCYQPEQLTKMKSECNELISIFVTSIKTLNSK